MARRCKQLQHIANLNLIVQIARDLATLLALDADAIALAIAGGRQRIVAALLHTIHDRREANVLTGQMGNDGTAIHGLQIEGGNLRALGFLAHHLEVARAAPAAFSSCSLVINAALGRNQNVCQLLVGGPPGGDDFVGRNLCPQHLTNGAQQARTHHGVMLGLHLQRHMLVDDLRGQVAQTFQTVDILGVHQHAMGQRTRLGTALLVGLVEQRAHLGVLGQHGLVEMGGQGFAAGFQQGDGGFDNLALTFGQHVTLHIPARPIAGLALFNANHMPALQPFSDKGLAKHESI